MRNNRNEANHASAAEFLVDSAALVRRLQAAIERLNAVVERSFFV